MPNEILGYLEMCGREGTSLQRGMNFGLGGTHSVILMSIRPNAPYQDRIEDDGTTIIYEGHDAPRGPRNLDPKRIDQPEHHPSGLPTQNGKFHRAAQDQRRGIRSPERVRVYEKLRSGIWSYNGMFHLVDSWLERSNGRAVFKFKLIAIVGGEDLDVPSPLNPERRRLIPTAVKLAVWKRDGGKCVVCGSSDELHFDHDLPYSRGGTSLKAENVQLLCSRHNLSKCAKIV